MYIQALLGGIISVLTPSVLLMIIISIIVFSKINFKNSSRLFTISIFCSLIVIYYVIIGIFLNSTTPSNLPVSSLNHTIKFLFVFLNISIGLWLLGLLKAFSQNIESNKLFKSIVVMIMSILFTVASYSGTAPIIGVMLISNSGATTIFATITPLLVFAIGLTIPIGLIVFLMSKFISKKKEKKWVIIAQILTGVLLIILGIVNIFQI